MHNFNIVYISLFFLVSIGIASEFIGRLNLSHLSLKVLSSSRAFANTIFSYTIELKNTSDTTSYAILIDNGISHKNIDSIGANRSVIKKLDTRFKKRGIHKLKFVQLESSYPLPHMNFAKRFKLENENVVYPEPKGKNLEEFLSKNHSTIGVRDDFDGIRKYESNDSASLIFWPSVAKQGNLMSKEFIFEESSHKLRFNFEQCAPDDESRLSQLTLWILECEKKGLNFSVLMPNILLDSQKESVDEILEILAKY